MPSDRQVIAAGAFFVASFYIVFLSGCKRDGDGLLRTVFVPLARGGPAVDGGDEAFVVGIVVGAEPEFGGVVAGDPEGVVAGGGGVYVAEDARAVVVGGIGWGFEGGDRAAAAWVVGLVRGAG